jgi:hypothetical protein
VTPLIAAGLLTFAAQASAQQGGPPPGQVQLAPLPPTQPPTVIIQQQYPPPVYQPPPYPQQGYPQQAQPYYVQPGTQPGQPIYIQQMPAPQSAPMSPRVIKDWDESQPIPPGYHQESHVRRGLVIGGAVLFGTTYLLSALSAAVVSDANSGSSNPAAALYIPAVGPFVEMGQVGSATAGFFLALDGLCQVGGITMFIVGLASPKTELVRNDFGFQLHLAPIISRDHSGMGLVGTF